MFTVSSYNKGVKMDKKNSIGSGKRLSPFTVYCILFTVFMLLFAQSVTAADKLLVKDSGGNTKFIVTDTGSVGIGTANPSTKLEVVADTVVGGWESVLTGKVSDAVGDNFYVINNTSSAGIFSPVFVGELGSAAVRNIDSALKFVGVIPPSRDTGTVAAIIFDAWKGTFASGSQLSRPSFQFHSYGTPLVTILSNGNVGIGTTNPANPLQMASGARVTTGGVWTNASSREYKENIQKLSSHEALLALNKLDPVKYNYKVDKNEKHVGFIAEDVPELVATQDRKSLSSMDIVAVLTKVLQEQQKTISELNDKVKRLEQQIK
jgi:hypothetical protein